MLQQQKDKMMPAYVMPFSHLDLFWTGTREECLSRGNFIIAKALKLLETHDDFRYLIETVNFLDHYLSCYPAEISRIKNLVKSGKLELGSLWSGIYQNLPAGETIARNSLYAKNYNRCNFEYESTVAHLGDLPGYTPQFPQIASLAEIKNVIITRCGSAEMPLFYWEGLDSSKILTYFGSHGYGYFLQFFAPNWLEKNQQAGEELNKLITDDYLGKEFPLLYHWGSDLVAFHEQVIANIHQWNEDQKRQMIFCTPLEYFKAVETVENIPALKGEQPSAWPNIESSWPDIWPEDLPCEAALHMAEFLSTFCLEKGWADYPASLLEEAWKSLLDGMDHNQNGQGGSVADRDKLQLKLWSRHSAEKIINKMSWRLASRIARLKDKAFPVVVFNSMSWKRTGIVKSRAAVFGEIRPTEGNIDFKDGAMLIDADGNIIPFVQVERVEGLSFALDLVFSAKDIPAAGYKTYYLVPGRNPFDISETCKITEKTNKSDHTFDRSHQEHIAYENDFFKLRVDTVTGEVTLYDKKLEKILFDKMAIIGVEERFGNYISDMTASGRVFPSTISKVETIENNAIRCSCKIYGKVYDVDFNQTITLYRDIPEISIENEIDWPSPKCVRLEQLFQYAGNDSDISYGVPYGYVRYPETMTPPNKFMDEIPVEDRVKLRLCRQWVDIGNDDYGVTIGCDHRMWEFDGKKLQSYMIRGIGYCFGIKRNVNGETENIPRPPKGKYKFKYCIRPRHTSLAHAKSYRCGWELNHPLLGVASCDTTGLGNELPAEDGLLDFSESSLIITGIKKAEQSNSIVLRGFESAGNSSEIKVPTFEGKIPWQTNILEEIRTPLQKQLTPFEIKTIIFD